MQLVWDWFRWLNESTGINLTIFYDAFDRRADGVIKAVLRPG